MPDSAALPIAGHRFVIVGGASLVGSATAAEFLDAGAAVGFQFVMEVVGGAARGDFDHEFGSAFEVVVAGMA